MITIGSPRIIDTNNGVRLSARISIDGKSSDELWVEVAEKYRTALCSDRVDAFVVALLNLAIKEHHDIVFEAPITSTLKDSIEHDFLDIICQNEPNLYHVKLTGPTIVPVFKEKLVRAAGCSCGVDSLYTIKRRMLSADFGERYLVVTNSHITCYGGREDANVQYRFDYLKSNAENLARELGIASIVIDTNYELSNIKGLTVGNCTTYCNCFCALTLQNLFSHYYIASGGPVRDFAERFLKNGFFGSDCSNYDLLSTQAFSVPSLKFVVDGLDRRVDKVKSLISWKYSWRHLDVCMKHNSRGHGFPNGTFDCDKCVHTINEIWAAGGDDALRKYRDVFDVDWAMKHRYKYLSDLMHTRIRGLETGRELWPVRGKYPLTDYARAALIIMERLMLKVVTFGKSSRKSKFER